MPFFVRPVNDVPAPVRPRQAVRRVTAAVAVLALSGTLVTTGVARADATKPMSPDRIAELTCGHLGQQCVSATSAKKRASRRARDARRRAARARA